MRADDLMSNLDLASPEPGPMSSTILSDTVAIATDERDTAGMTFAEMFRHYLAPEVAKLPPSVAGFGTLPPLPPLPSGSVAFRSPEANNAFAGADILPLYSPGIPSGMGLGMLTRSSGSEIDTFSPESSTTGSIAYGSTAAGAFDYEFGLENARDAGGVALDDWSMDPRTMLQDDSADPFGLLAPAPAPAPKMTTRSRRASTVAAATPQPRAPVAITSRRVKAAPIEQVAEENESDESDEEEEDIKPIKDEEMSPPPMASASHQPFTKKASGNANKKLSKTSVSLFATPTLHATSAKSTLTPVPNWTDRPDPEAYKQLGSKEKRQLRNKISARNFRHRRKEYITTLEDEISSRDTIIGELSTEVTSLKTDNASLKTEVSRMQAQWTSMMSKMGSLSVSTLSSSDLLTPHALPPLPLISPTLSSSEATGHAIPRPSSSNAGVARPNLHKDVAPSSKRTGTGSWTTNGMGTGGYTGVHSMMLPEFRLIDKPLPAHTLPCFEAPAPPQPHVSTFLSAELAFQSPTYSATQESSVALELMVEESRKLMLELLVAHVLGAVVAGMSREFVELFV